ncbi:hypothetical protein KVF89_01420 [Nocardioides carbamazepini]|uniref:hypothetical protein n=1 Tax=Nocardioides carbamazepini TaxID=2854259 RepID=UPI002149AFC2|nr:hypothetical protein [Nocardioides carbamazepini]MCR1781181.1 hypothetical protein [Nocardioides carbamazepini]
MSSTWGDWKQDQRIEEAEAQLAAERRARNRLAEQMRAQQGNTQAQLDRLTRALVALVEHEDIRSELGQYADAAACRRYAREVVSTVVATGGAALRASLEPADVPGYWLAAAARGVAATARGEAGGAALLEEAALRDRGRTALLLTLIGALTRDPRWAPAPDEGVLPDALVVTHAQRQAWLAIAEGRLPAAFAEALAEALGRQVTATGSAGPDEVAAWLEGRVPADRHALSAEKAAAQLEVLHQVLSTGVPSAAPEAAEPSATEPAAGGAVPEAPEDPMADCLRSLIDEGSPGEAEILDRMATARADMGFLDERVAVDARIWNASAGDVLSLLLRDLGEPVADGRYAVARRVLAPVLGAIGDELVQQAAAPAPGARTVEVVGEVLTVDREGARADWQQRVMTGFDRRHPLDRRLLPTGIGLLGLGAVGCLLGAVSGGFLLLGLLALGAGAGLVVGALLKRRRLDRSRTSTVAETARQIDQEAAAVRDDGERSAAAAARAAELHRSVSGSLATVPS